ncbi:MAG: extracellular solute-binding protein [Acetobacteraceae bacterium]|nr:extracellular solute-binding protein [Acetobacteraceae bacterium]
MIRRRHLLGASAALPLFAIVERANAQSKFDWKMAKGAAIEVNFQKGPNADVLQAHQKEFEELTGIKVGSEQIPEQQQRPKVALELSAGRPSFDVVSVALHVQKRLVERGKWMEDLRNWVNNANVTAPEFDFADFAEPGLRWGTAADGTLHTLPTNQDVWLMFWNKAIFAEKGVAFPKTMDEMYEASRALTDKSKGIYGMVGRGLKNANLPLYTSFLMGMDQDTISKDGKTLLMDTPAAVWAGELYKKLLTETAPPGTVGFNWMESQTSFSQGKVAMWIDGIGFSAPLIDPTKSRVAKDIGFSPVPPGPKAQHSATFCSGLSIPVATKKKLPAWLYIQWAASKEMGKEQIRLGAGTPPRVSVWEDAAVQKASPFPKEWFETSLTCQKIGRPGLPEIVSVTEFRDVFGIALTNTLAGADVKTELVKATEAFKPILAKELAG